MVQRSLVSVVVVSGMGPAEMEEEGGPRGNGERHGDSSAKPG